MHRRTALWGCGATAALGALAALGGCGDIIGLGGYTDGDGSVVLDSGGGDAKGDVVVPPPDAGPDGAACNSATSVCVPDLPSGGWAWAAYDPDARVACAASYASPTDVEEGIDAGDAVCSCGCTMTNPDCTTGNVTITAGSNGACDNFTNQTDPASANCHALTTFGTSNDSISVTGPAPSGGSCSPTSSQTLPPVAYAHQGRTCGYAGTPGGGCAAGSVCVPDPAPFAMCIAQVGTVACPAGFPTQHLVGTSVTDTRSCSACGCTFDAGACTGTTTLYTTSNCSTGNQNVTADGNCHTVNGNRTWRGYQYNPTSTASCAGTAVSPDGGVAFADITTVCCP
jgi:hypothetical protein